MRQLDLMGMMPQWVEDKNAEGLGVRVVSVQLPETRCLNSFILPPQNASQERSIEALRWRETPLYLSNGHLVFGSRTEKGQTTRNWAKQVCGVDHTGATLEGKNVHVSNSERIELYERRVVSRDPWQQPCFPSIYIMPGYSKDRLPRIN